MGHVNDHLGPVHNTHLTTIRRCKKKFDYAFIQNIQPKTPALPLARGIWLHYCLQAQNLLWGIEDGTLLLTPESIEIDGVGEVFLATSANGKHLLSVPINEEYDYETYDLSAAGMLKLLVEQVWNKLFEEEHEKYTESGHTLPEACKRILEEYFYHYKDELTDRNFEVLLVEYEWKNEYDGVEFEGRIDVLIRDKERDLLVLRDWKSSNTTPGAEYKFMESQLNLYPWGISRALVNEFGLDKKDVSMMAVEYDYLSTKLPTIPKQNQDGRLSKANINTTELTFRRALKEYGITFTENHKRFLETHLGTYFERKRLPRNKKVVRTLLDENVSDAAEIYALFEDGDFITRTVRYTCAWDCDFMDLCKGELYGQDIRHVKKSKYEPRTNLSSGVVDKDE